MAKAKKVTRKKVSKKSTHVALVLDKSGSMGTCWQEAMNGFNAQLEVILANADKGGKTTVSLITFNTNVDILQDGVNPDSVKKLDQTNYCPEGGTAMYDAVWEAIKVLEAKDDKGAETAFLVVTISDGEENSSRNVSVQQLAAKVAELNLSERWTFAYIGANQDLSKVSEHLGFAVGNSLSYTADSAGYRGMSAGLTGSLNNYFSNRSVGVACMVNMMAPPATVTGGSIPASGVVHAPYIPRYVTTASTTTSKEKDHV